MNNTLKAALLVSSALVATPVMAQNVEQITPPEHYTLDPRGVDLVSGYFSFMSTEVSIGQPGAGGLSLTRGRVNLGWRDSNQGSIGINGSTITVVMGLQSEVFTLSGSTYTPASNNGSSLTRSGAVYTYTTSSGTVARYSTSYCYSAAGSPCTSKALISEIVAPNGDTANYHYVTRGYIRSTDSNGDPVLGTLARLQSVTNNRGYQLHYNYHADSTAGSGTLATRVSNWLRVASVTGVNNAVDYCAPTAFSCSYSQTWPSINYVSTVGGPITSATDQSGRTTQYFFGSSGDLTGIRYPGSSANDVTIANSTPASRATSVTDLTGTWNYTYTDSGTTRTTVSAGPNGQQLTAVADLTIGRATSFTEATAPTTSGTTSFTYDSQKRLKRTTQPEGNYVEVTYDARGNITQTVASPKSGSGLGAITTSATYPASCGNPVICNLPTSTTDARGGVTTYIWNPTHGGLETAIATAPAPGGIQPQTRASYASQTAYYKNSAGTIVAAPGSIILPVSVSSCATNAAPACVGTADELRQTIQYGSAGAANNLLPTVATQRDGTGALSASVATAYTANGDVASVDGPLPGAEDTTYYRYDTARRPVGVIGPDTDGSGSLMRRAQRVTYDAGSRPTQVEVGAVNGISDGDWNGFVSLQQQLTAYDGFGRPVVVAQHGGGQAHAVIHVSYDAAGRQACVAQRMNPAAFNSLPGSACELGAAGAYGPDRITNYQYDEAGRLKQSTAGYLSGSPITEQATYTANGKPLTLKDGAGNVSTMVYDGFDRLLQLRYPDATTGSGMSSTSDYEQYGYDANSNVTSFRNRAGETIGRNYDALNRMVVMGGSAIADRTISYDNLNRVKGMNFTSGGASFANTYDALGRLISQTQAGLGTVSYGYDLAGRRTSMTWPDGFWVAYDYNLANEPTAIRENGATNWQLASWAYDNLGRRIAQGNANGSTTTWGYDDASRLTSLSHDLAGTANDLTLSFSYNPAGQIVSRTMSNPAYAYTPGTGNTAYANNGKNQVTSVNGNGVGYDSRGNITSIPGGGSYGYNGANELTTANTSGLVYDPSGRLFQISSGNVATRFLYDGQQAIGEYDQSGTLLKRYVPGLGLDNVLAAYEGATYDRRYLLADERGSVVSIADGAANALTTNTYDEYGQPGSANAGRFQYTGQMWLPQAQLYHYRARAYAPQLGRFMQTDPIGYAAGANVYSYVGADPMNMIDRLGLTGGPVDLPGPTVTGSRCPSNAVCDLENIQRIIDGLTDQYLNGPIANLGEIVVTGSKKSNESCPTGSALGDAGTIVGNTLGGAEAGAQVLISTSHGVMPEAAGRLFSWPGRVVKGVSAVVNVVENTQAGNTLSSALLEEAVTQGIDAGIGVAGTAVGGVAGFALCGPPCAAVGGYLGGAGAGWVADHFGVSRSIARWTVGRNEGNGC